MIYCQLAYCDRIIISGIINNIKLMWNSRGNWSLNISATLVDGYSVQHQAMFFLQNRLDAIDTEKAVDFVLSCMNFDGGFGSRPGSESHSGQVWHILMTLFKLSLRVIII